MRRQTIDFEAVEKNICAGYREIHEKYRSDDEIELNSDNHQRLHRTLSTLCDSFHRPIRVLDVGCGTGRYFHCLTNVAELIGLDISEEMLAAARRPLLADSIEIPSIQLIRGNAHLTDFDPDSFDLVYSLGMFGHGCPVTPEILFRIHRWLRPGGQLFFDTIDFRGLPGATRLRRKVRAIVYPLLPAPFKSALDRREGVSPLFALTQRQLQDILQESPFRKFEIRSEICKSPLWSGRHLECVAQKW